MNILDLLDEEADRIQYDTMQPSASQVRGAENLYNDRQLIQQLENKVESHFVIATVGSPVDEEYEEDSGIEAIVEAINDMSSKLSTSISNINLNFSDRFEKEQESRTESITYLEKIYELHRDEFKRQERERLMDVRPDIDPSGVETSATGSVNPYAQGREANANDSGGFELPSFMDFGNKDRDKDKDRGKDKKDKRSRWSKTKDFAKSPKGKWAGAIAALAATAGGAYAFLSGDDEATTPTSDRKPVDDPWNYGESGHPLANLENAPAHMRERIELERIEKWKQRGAPEVNVAVPDSSSSPTDGMQIPVLAKLAMGASAISAVAPMLDFMPNPLDWIGSSDSKPKALPSPNNVPSSALDPKKLPAPNAKPSLLSRAGSAIKPASLLGKANVVANVGLGAINAYDIYNDDTLSTKDKTVELSGVAGSVGGGMAGAAAGAAAGTFIGGPVGTIIGGILGGAAGAMLGEAGVESLTDSIYSWFDEDEVEEKAAETAAVPTEKAEDAVKQVNEETTEELVTRINAAHATKMKEVEELESAEAQGQTQAIVDNKRVFRENGEVRSVPIDRTLSSITKKIQNRRNAYANKLSNPLKNYAKANNVPDSAVSNVLDTYSNPALSFSDATIISRDLLNDSEFNPDDVITQFQKQVVSNPTDFSTITPVSNFVAETSYPVNTQLGYEGSTRENFVEVREVTTESQYDKAAEVAKAENQNKPEVSKSKPQKPRVVKQAVQAPLSLNLIDNLGNQAGFNYVGTTYG